MSHALYPLPASVAVTAALLLSGCDGGTTSAEPRPSESRSSSRATTPEPGGSTAPAASEPRTMSGVDGPLEPGRWTMALWSDSEALPQAVVDVPAGYETPGGGVVYREGESPTGEVSFWTVSEVYADACHDDEPVAVGPSVDDLADALVAQAGHHTSRPQPVTLDGHRGLHLQVTWPDQAGLEGCRNSSLRLWRTGTAFYDSADPRTELTLWVLDVDGTRVVITSSATPDDALAERAELVGIATSTHFTDPAEPAA